MDSSINELELLRYLAPTYFVWEKGDDFPEWIDDLISWGIVEQCDGKLKTYDGEHSYEAHPGDVIVRSADGAWVVSKERVPRTALARSAPGWRDMDSAPKDGTMFLAYIRHNVGGAERWAVAWAPSHLNENSRYAWWVTQSDVGCPIVETHSSVDNCWIMEAWQPLPAPPASNSGEGE